MGGIKMLSKVRSAAILGIDAYAVEVETDMNFGIPGFSTVGLPDASVKESKDRVKSAINNSELEFPQKDHYKSFPCRPQKRRSVV
jgi:magnesium chelatase family protein